MRLFRFHPISPGAGRTTRKEFIQFVTIARSSLNELETQCLLARSLGLLPDDEPLDREIDRLHGLLNGLRNALAKPSRSR